ncbi:hypothetical protein F5Y15DRAFT_420976 [Xylariaceae sp. FL0016]|nr:hypothetical protein F5Y15DRAFT_420976 [Xylariaceae sp. FL0016]
MSSTSKNLGDDVYDARGVSPSKTVADDSEEVKRAKARAKKKIAIRTSMMGTLSDALDEMMGEDVRQKFRDNLEARGNIPSIDEHYVPRSEWRPSKAATSDKLWVVDRVLEWQTLGQFISIATGTTTLPTGETLSEPLDDKEWFLITKKYSEWAPSPFNEDDDMAPIDQINNLIGSMGEGRGRMQIISKELQAMKARIWEGIMPLSARRWQEKQLYDLTNFSEACRLLSMVVSVFLYLNDEAVQATLRETFTLVDGVLQTFEEVLNAKRELEGKFAVEVADKWHLYIRAKYAVMVNRSHGWVIDHVQHLKGLVLQEIEAHARLRDEIGADVHDEKMVTLYDMWQDLSEIASKADYAILISMDGYDGSEVHRQPTDYKYRSRPLRAATDIRQRNMDYHSRRGHLVTKLQIDAHVARIGKPEASQFEEAMEIPRLQEAGQKMARAELRGEPVQYDKEPWSIMIGDSEQWGFVVYRACHSCTDDEWDSFRTRFDADQADWGSELKGIDKLRERSQLHWLDAKDFGVNDEDIEALKSSFNTFAKNDDFPPGFASDMFLVADEASVRSYLSPQPESSPPGEAGGHISVIDADFDHDEGASRPNESPGYSGTLRVLSSLLWDDLSALVASYSQSLERLWPLAMGNPVQVYTGPKTSVQDVLPRSLERQGHTSVEGSDNESERIQE